MRDMESIAAYISRDSEFHASMQIELFLASVKRLRVHPKSGKIIPEIGHSSLREVLVGNYRIMYRVESKELVEIITVHHSARRFPFGRFLTKKGKPKGRR